MREPVPARNAADLKKFEALGIETRADLLVHYPWRYADSREVTDIASLAIGLNVALIARVRGAQMKHAAKTGRPRVEATITDGNRSLSLVIFTANEGVAQWHLARLVVGELGLFSGEINVFNGRLQLANPVYQILGSVEDEARAMEEAEWPIPIYPATKGLDSETIRAALRKVLDPLTDARCPTRCRPRSARRRGLGSRLKALRDVHVPREEADVHRGQARLRYEEASCCRPSSPVGVRGRSGRRRRRDRRGTGGLLEAFDARLPFDLTPGQLLAGAQIGDDLALDRPDAAAAAGRGRLGQDGRGAAGDAAGHRRGGAGGDARTDVRAGRPAHPDPAGPPG